MDESVKDFGQLKPINYIAQDGNPPARVVILNYQVGFNREVRALCQFNVAKLFAPLNESPYSRLQGI